MRAPCLSPGPPALPCPASMVSHENPHHIRLLPQLSAKEERSQSFFKQFSCAEHENLLLLLLLPRAGKNNNSSNNSCSSTSPRETGGLVPRDSCCCSAAGCVAQPQACCIPHVESSPFRPVSARLGILGFPEQTHTVDRQTQTDRQTHTEADGHTHNKLWG